MNVFRRMKNILTIKQLHSYTVKNIIQDMNDAPHFCLDILVCINHQQLFNKEMSS